MKGLKAAWRGKVWIAILPVLLLASLPLPARADAQYDVLDQPAIAVRLPAQALMIGIARAGKRLVAVGDQGTIIYSDDNGQSWRQAAVPVQATLTRVAFATPEIGWAAGAYGVILRTTDGGKTWVKQIYGGKIIQLMLASASQLVAADPGAPAAQTALRRAHIFMAAGADKPFLAIVAKSPQSVELFGAYRMAVSSNDGGQSWSDVSLHIGDPVSHNLYDAAWIGNALYLAGEAGTVLRSDDQGANFTLLPAPSDTTLLGILDAGKNIILTYGVAGAMFTSHDKGVSWQPVNLPVQANLTAGLVLKSGAILVLSETGGMLLSNDHGASFRLLSVNEDMGIFGAAQAANGDVVFLGSGGVRVISTAGLN
jgi:photosystem II stability/assembly factor-like uncharacterized protein